MTYKSLKTKSACYSERVPSSFLGFDALSDLLLSAARTAVCWARRIFGFLPVAFVRKWFAGWATWKWRASLARWTSDGVRGHLRKSLAGEKKWSDALARNVGE